MQISLLKAVSKGVFDSAADIEATVEEEGGEVSVTNLQLGGALSLCLRASLSIGPSTFWRRRGTAGHFNNRDMKQQ